MPRDNEFETLAEAAVVVGKAIAITYRVDVRSEDGSLEAVGDIHNDFDAAYDDYVESHKFWNHEDLIVWEIASDGSATDITDRMIYENEMICEARGIPSFAEEV